MVQRRKEQDAIRKIIKNNYIRVQRQRANDFYKVPKAIKIKGTKDALPIPVTLRANLSGDTYVYVAPSDPGFVPIGTFNPPVSTEETNPGDTHGGPGGFGTGGDPGPPDGAPAGQFEDTNDSGGAGTGPGDGYRRKVACYRGVLVVTKYNESGEIVVDQFLYLDPITKEFSTNSNTTNNRDLLSDLQNLGLIPSVPGTFQFTFEFHGFEQENEKNPIDHISQIKGPPNNGNNTDNATSSNQLAEVVVSPSTQEGSVVVATGNDLDPSVSPTIVASNDHAFAYVNPDTSGTVVAWGHPNFGGNITPVANRLTNVTGLFTNKRAFVAQRSVASDPEIVTWGFDEWGGNSSISLSVSGLEIPSLSASLASFNNIQAVYSNDFAFAVTRSQGDYTDLITWGKAEYGGDSSNTRPNGGPGSMIDGLFNIRQVVAGRGQPAFAALGNDNTLRTWGHRGFGGAVVAATSLTGSPVLDAFSTSGTVFEELSTNILSVSGTNGAFCAVRDNGDFTQIFTWGASDRGSITSSNPAVSAGGIVSLGGLINPVARGSGHAIFPNDRAFAGIFQTGVDTTEVFAWGNGNAGGYRPGGIYNEFAKGYDAASAPLGTDDQGTPLNLKDVYDIIVTKDAFAALKNGTQDVIVWGNPNHGGNTKDLLTADPSALNSILEIYSNDFAFAAIKQMPVDSQGLPQQNAVVTWGKPSAGGDSSGVSTQLRGIVDIVSSKLAFAALKSDGTVVTWGEKQFGGNAGDKQSLLTNVTKIYSTRSAFLAIRSVSPSIVTWGGTGNFISDDTNFDIYQVSNVE